MITAEVTGRGVFDMQVCVPECWNNAEAVAFAERENRCGTSNGWTIRKQGNPRLDGADERVVCASRAGHVHIMLEA